MSKAIEKEKKYEELMDELNILVQKMENPETSLEEQLSSYEKGMKLCNELYSMLKSFEDRIMIVNSEGKEESFE